MKQQHHLPLYGIGPFYVGVIVLLTAGGIFFHQKGLLANGQFPALRLPAVLLGSCLILFGIWLWCAAVLRDKIDRGILENQLITNGVYGLCRNPIYTACTFACVGALLLCNNLWLLLLPPLYWLFLTLLLKHTEEKWLLQQYGSAYTAYCSRVNRCLPFPKKSEKS